MSASRTRAGGTYLSLVLLAVVVGTAVIAWLCGVLRGPDAASSAAVDPAVGARPTSGNRHEDPVRLHVASDPAIAVSRVESAGPQGGDDAVSSESVVPPSPMALSWQGRYADAITGFRKELAEATDPVRRVSCGDRLAVAILEGGRPAEVASYTGEWIAALCRDTLKEGARRRNSSRQYSIWSQTSPDRPTIELGGRLMTTMLDMRVLRSGYLSAQRRLLERLGEVQSEANERDAALLQDIRDFLELSSAYLPSIAPTADAVAAKILPRVKRFIADHAESEEPSLGAMAAWLRVRYAALLPSRYGHESEK